MKFIQLWLRAFSLFGFLVLGSGTHLYAAIGAGFSEYYVPGDEEHLVTVFHKMNTVVPVEDDMYTTISVTAIADDTVIHYDHWENGYAADLTIAANADQVITLQKGEVHIFQSRVRTGTNRPSPVINECALVTDTANPPAYTHPCYDGKDRFYTTGGPVTVSRASWTDRLKSVLGIAWEVYPSKALDTTYSIPFSQALDLRGYSDFLDSSYLVQATQDNTEVRIDGILVATLAKGEEYLVLSNTDGDDIVASNPVQIKLIVGNHNRNYEARGFTAVPVSEWSKTYYVPVGSIRTGGGSLRESDVYIYNQHATDLTISYEDKTGSGSFIVPAGEVRSFREGAGRFLAENSSAVLEGDKTFWGIASIDTESATYDWGHSLIPDTYLTDDYLIGWTPGSLPSGSGIISENSSPLFATPTLNGTTIFVDLPPIDGTADLTFPNVNKFDMIRIYDNDSSRRNLTGSHVWSTNPIALVWGEDPAVASTGSPALDMGYTTLPQRDEWLDLAFSANKSTNSPTLGLASGQQATFTLLFQSYQNPMTTIVAKDILPTGWSYVSSSAHITQGDGTVITGAAADPVVSGQELTWDAGKLGGMAVDQNLTVSYDAVTTMAFTDGTITVNQIEANATDTDGTVFNVSDQETTRFVTTPPGRVTGSVLNGVTPLIGVTIEIQDGAGSVVNDVFGNPLTTTTDASGNYSFDNVPLGDYVIVETNLIGYASVSDGDTSDDSDTVANTNTNDDQIPLTIISGEVDADNNFVDIALGSISGTVLADTNNDNTGDAPLSGVSMTLFEVDAVTAATDAGGNPIPAVVTAADGSYTFTNVPAGNYVLKETNPASHASISDTDGANDDAIAVTVVSGPVTGNDFVDTPVSDISGTVLADTNNDNTGDAPLAAATVTLYEADGVTAATDANGTTIAAIDTDGTGVYIFTNVPAGTYVIKEINPVGYISVSDVNGANDDTINITSPVVPVAVTGQDFVDKIVPAPSITLIKTVVSGANGALGDTITYNFEVNNTGNVDLTNVTLTDVNATVSGGPISLAAGAGDNSTFSATHVITAADIAAGSVTNQALVTGTPPSGPDVNDTSDDNSPVEDDPTVTPVAAQNPSISVEKTGTFMDEDHDGYANVGETVSYEFNVTNTGNVILTNVSLIDDNAVITGGPIVSIIPGESDTITFTAMHTLTWQDIIDGKVINQAIVTGKDPQGNDINDISDDPQNPVDYDENNDGEPDDETSTGLPIKPPASTDDTGVGTTGEDVIIDIVNNDTGGTFTLDATTVTLTPSAGATDVVTVDGDVIGFVVPGEGTWSVDETTGEVTFSPEDGYVGDPTPIEYTIEDEQGNETTSEIIINYPPVANDDNATADRDEVVTLDVLANDQNTTDSLDPTTVRLIGPGGNETETLYVLNEGTWTVESNGSVTFEPDMDFSDNASITYIVRETNGDISNEATITIQYPGVPLATDNGIILITEYAPTVIDVLANGDSWGSNGPGTTEITFTQPTYGTVALDDGGTQDDPTDDVLIYTPYPDYNDINDSFTYTITDALGFTSTANVTLYIECGSSQTSDGGDTLGVVGMLIMMFLTATAGLYFIRREEERGEA